jgi:hypothetical protein
MTALETWERTEHDGLVIAPAGLEEDFEEVGEPVTDPSPAQGPDRRREARGGRLEVQHRDTAAPRLRNSTRSSPSGVGASPA